MKLIGNIVITKLSTFTALQNNFRTYESDFSVLKETFIQEQYAWLVENLKPDTIAIDIGANIGDSAIYLAMQLTIKEVWAYEPYPSIFKRLKQNIDSSKRKNKIKIFNEAVSKPNSDYWFNIDKPALEPQSDAYLKLGSGEKIHAIGLDKILNQINSKNVIVKMDCEGGEYYILDKNLDLSKVYKMQIEAHKEYGNPNSLVSLLESKGFNVKLDKGMSEQVEWIYAWV